MPEMPCGCARPGVCFHCMACGAGLSQLPTPLCTPEAEAAGLHHIAQDGE